MNKNNYRLNHLFFLLLIALFQSCNSQTKDNPQYIGEKYGSFNLDKSTFNENAETLFSKIKFIKIKEKLNNKLFYVYRVENSNQKDGLFEYFNIDEGDVEVYVNENNKIILFSGMKQVKKDEAEEFLQQIRKKYKKQEIISKKNQFIDDSFIGIIDNKLIHITSTCFKEGNFKGDCNVIYEIYKYPQKDTDAIQFIAPNSIEVENLLKK